MRIILFLALMFPFISIAEEKESIVVVIDPGHGGKDHGKLASSSDLKPEKSLNLDIAKKLGQYIESNLSNVTVIYTRTDDSYPTLDDRVDLANSKKADYFISIHCNGSPNSSSAKGTETHINSWDNKKSLNLAKTIEQEFKSRAKRKSRGIKTSADRHHSLQVLKETKMPSVLVEAGFMSNPDEEKYLNSTYGQEIIASAIFRAFRTYITKQHPNITFTEPQEEGPFYRVQIMSSIDKVDTTIPEFKKLNKTVTRVEVESSSMYKYKYLIGKTKDKKEAKKVMKYARENGFPDAYIVRY